MPGFSVSEYFCFYHQNIWRSSVWWHMLYVSFAFCLFVPTFMFPNRLTTLPLVTIFLILDLIWMKLYELRFFHHLRRYRNN
jgi:hypothetical protein